ncbi:hypothetical protein CEXT_37991 [Caerostris extrusa]|uniref:Uncharacterized protein n=1 Tax=Caerostris extrusa TaxID=172846 RepID=A0AAV4TUL8_CAEEX|nr:hypothetical protein CEXT_37991 [Caerostris extrusa]
MVQFVVGLDTQDHRRLDELQALLSNPNLPATFETANWSSCIDIKIASVALLPSYHNCRTAHRKGRQQKMAAVMYSLLFVSIGFSLASFLAAEDLKAKQDPLPKSSLLADNASHEFFQRIRRQVFSTQGVTKPFCDMFGCYGCTPPKGSKCCAGFKYDAKAKKCREVFV